MLILAYVLCQHHLLSAAIELKGVRSRFHGHDVCAGGHARGERAGVDEKARVGVLNDEHHPRFVVRILARE